jgi:hypothetical protein
VPCIEKYLALCFYIFGVQFHTTHQENQANNIQMSGPDSATLRLETFLDSVLRKSLEEALLQRDEILTMASSCTHLRQTLKALRDVNLPLSPIEVTSSSSTSPSSNAPVTSVDASLPPTMMLVDIGHRFFMQAHVKNPSLVHVNVGCGVVIPMQHSEAETFLEKKESLLAERAKRKTQDILRIKFRMRLVMEAISRLQQPTE